MRKNLKSLKQLLQLGQRSTAQRYFITENAFGYWIKKLKTAIIFLFLVFFALRQDSLYAVPVEMQFETDKSFYTNENGKNEIQLSWTSPSFSSCSEGTTLNYDVERKGGTIVEFTQFSSTQETSYSFQPVQQNFSEGEWTFRILAKCCFILCNKLAYSNELPLNIDRTAPIIIEGPYVTFPDSTKSKISFKTSESVHVILSYGLDTNYGTDQTSDGSDFAFNLSSLSESKTYYFQIKFADAAGNSNFLNSSFTTGDTTPPSLVLAFATDNHGVALEFNEPVTLTGASFQFSPSLSVDTSTSFVAGYIIFLTTGSQTASSYSLSFTVKDLVGNIRSGTTSFPSKPNTPPSVVISQAPTQDELKTGKATFSWEGFDPDGDTVTYQYHSRLSDTFTAISTATITLTLSDGSYAFEVKACDTSGCGSAAPVVPFVISTSATLLPPPTNVTATADENKVYLSWTSVSGATSYKVYRVQQEARPTESQLVFLTSTTGTSHTDSSLINGQRYWYAVSAMNAQGEGLKSSAVSAVPKKLQLFIRGLKADPSQPLGQSTVTLDLDADEIKPIEIHFFAQVPESQTTGGQVESASWGLTLQIFKEGEAVYTFSQERHAVKPAQENNYESVLLWNGTDDSGEYVQDGTYTVSLTGRTVIPASVPGEQGTTVGPISIVSSGTVETTAMGKRFKPSTATSLGMASINVNKKFLYVILEGPYFTPNSLNKARVALEAESGIQVVWVPGNPKNGRRFVKIINTDLINEAIINGQVESTDEKVGHIHYVVKNTSTIKKPVSSKKDVIWLPAFRAKYGATPITIAVPGTNVRLVGNIKIYVDVEQVNRNFNEKPVEDTNSNNTWDDQDELKDYPSLVTNFNRAFNPLGFDNLEAPEFIKWRRITSNGTLVEKIVSKDEIVQHIIAHEIGHALLFWNPKVSNEEAGKASCGQETTNIMYEDEVIPESIKSFTYGGCASLFRVP